MIETIQTDVFIANLKQAFEALKLKTKEEGWDRDFIDGYNKAIHDVVLTIKKELEITD